MTDDQDKLPSDAEDVDLKPKTKDGKAKEPTSAPKDEEDEKGPSEQPS